VPDNTHKVMRILVTSPGGLWSGGSKGSTGHF
jgi:hypothetical protein